LCYFETQLQENEIEYVLNKKMEQNRRHQERMQLINNHVQKNGYIKLRCNYYGTCSYFYDLKTKTMYEVQNTNGDHRDESPPEFKICTDPYLLELNQDLISC
jgi:hypothetical protein